jgi:hypothetical protein
MQEQEWHKILTNYPAWGGVGVEVLTQGKHKHTTLYNVGVLFLMPAFRCV